MENNLAPGLLRRQIDVVEHILNSYACGSHATLFTLPSIQFSLGIVSCCQGLALLPHLVLSSKNKRPLPASQGEQTAFTGEWETTCSLRPLLAVSG